jgi:hypothetical protein
MLHSALMVCIFLSQVAALQAPPPRNPPTAPPAAAPTAPPTTPPTAPPGARPAAPPTAPPGAPPTAVGPTGAAPPAAPAVLYDTGPLRAEITAMREIRLRYVDDADKSAAESQFAMQVRVSGEKLGSITRFGNLILSELVDDKGHSMLDPNSPNEQEKTQMYPMSIPKDRLSSMGLLVMARGRPAERTAEHIKAKGTIHVVLGEKPEKITILNPLQYLGKTIPDPRLAELGVTVRVVPTTELKQPVQGQCVVLQYVTKPENVKDAALYDGWMRQLPAGERKVPAADDKECVAYCFESTAALDEIQLVLNVHAKVEDVQLELNAENVPLP